MELYLLRHGSAEDSHPAGDPARELTDEGRAQTAAVVAAARQGGMNPSLILSSPYIRAKQTAAIAGSFTTMDSLTPYGSPEALWSDVRDYPHEPAILLASHEPLMSHFAAWLLGCPSLQIQMKKSALIRIDLSGTGAQPRGILRWMLTPALCQKVGK
jgi:phosphohistidine phosphatase